MMEANVYQTMMRLIQKLGADRAKDYVFASDYPFEIKIESIGIIEHYEQTRLADAMVEAGSISDIISEYAS
jgi:thymidine phosphorylase